MPPQQFSCGFYFWYVVEGEWRMGSSWNDAISCPIQIPNLGRLSTHTATNEKKSSSYHSYPFKNNTRAPGPIEQGRRTIASVCLLLHKHTDTRSRSSLVVDPSLYVCSYALNDSWLFDRWKPVGAFGLGFRRRCAIMKNSLHWPAAQMPTVGTARNVPGIEIICDHGYCLLLFIYLFIYLFVCFLCTDPQVFAYRDEWRSCRSEQQPWSHSRRQPAQHCREWADFQPAPHHKQTGERLQWHGRRVGW